MTDLKKLFTEAYNLVNHDYRLISVLLIFSVAEVVTSYYPQIGLLSLILSVHKIALVMTVPYFLNKITENKAFTVGEFFVQSYKNFRRLFFPVINLLVLFILITFVAYTLLHALNPRLPQNPIEMVNSITTSDQIRQLITLFFTSVISSIFLGTAVFFSVTNLSFAKSLTASCTFSYKHRLFTLAVFIIFLSSSLISKSIQPLLPFGYALLAPILTYIDLLLTATLLIQTKE